ncbi:cation:dicarboxylate symporter family transporter [Marinomonas rhodophyticola]|uniref:Cation:dicarboxylase symporter family transporter n=1 Tax=Marinomonas rhodophyticola TaxID=2992803 RepID=A0ABT3KFC8_9GAMM|nr:cation:dicarboxylase symporter family transporter [Marinomonas sp. KJ51-3]MCW4629149.1 cation:dicarboxylase symporter family transporter [Marinomonas sp. KJ51-3]
MLYPILNLAVFALLIALLFKLQKAKKTLSTQVFTGLGLGVVFGAALQFIYGVDSAANNETLEYVSIVGYGYVSLLKMIIMPLILVSIIGAIVKVKDTELFGQNVWLYHWYFAGDDSSVGFNRRVCE